MKNKLFLICLFLSNFHFFAQKDTFQHQVLKKNELENIKNFAKTYGIVRHFHPSTEIENFEFWEEFLLYGIKNVKKINNKKQLNKTLENLFKPLAPTIRFSVNNKNIKSEELFSFKTDSVFYKKNIGWSDKKRARVRPIKYERYYVSTIEKTSTVTLKPFLSNPNNYLEYFLSPKSFLYLPQTLYAKNNITQPVAKNLLKLTPIKKFDVSNIDVRIGSIIIFWNVMQHFYPYKDLLNIDTEKILTQYLTEASLCKSENDFFNLLGKMSHEYKDNHLLILRNNKEKWEQYMPPFKIENIGGKPTVFWIDNKGIKDINIGDEIVSVDGVGFKTFFKNNYQLYSGATDGYIKYMTYWRILQGKKNSFVEVGLKTKNGKIIHKKYQRTLNIWDYKNFPMNKIKYDEYKKGYYYVNMTNIKNDTLSFLMDNKFPSAKGIIFDNRNSYYQKRDNEILAHITKKPLFAPPFEVPVYYFPNQNKKGLEKNIIYADYLNMLPKNPKYTDNIVFLFDNQMYSGRETIASLIKYFGLGTIVGRDTGGTNGNTSIVKLFDLYRFFFTGMEVLQYDGSPFHGVGIKPDIYIDYKLEDLLLGKDTFIEKAKEVLK